ncbi:MAG: nitronate monooxygenase [Deltaproteobacteria bacterium]|nr:nitronate monooxygenase [Deltaproteobacteria bacterium]
MKSRLCEICSIRVPLFLGPMRLVSTAPLVAAFCQAGGLGCLASAGLSEKRFRLEVEEIRKQTSSPFAVNIAWTTPGAQKVMAWCLAESIGVVISSAGCPEAGLSRLKEKGLTVLQVVANVDQARNAEGLGVDGVITKGYESGGLNARQAVASLPLIPMVADAVSIPVIAAGGIADGRGVAAALALGAEGVLMGTRFLASQECPIHPNYKEAILRGSDTDTIDAQFQRFSVRLWKNPTALNLSGEEPLWEAMADFSRGDDAINKVWSVGQVAGLITRCPSVQEIFEDIITGFREASSRLQKISSLST